MAKRLGVSVETIIDNALREAGERKSARDGRVEIPVRFTASQLARLQRAARVIGRKTTIEELVVSGALSGLDMAASLKADAIESTLGQVRCYARQRRAAFWPGSLEDGLQHA